MHRLTGHVSVEFGRIRPWEGENLVFNFRFRFPLGLGLYVQCHVGLVTCFTRVSWECATIVDTFNLPWILGWVDHTQCMIVNPLNVDALVLRILF